MKKLYPAKAMVLFTVLLSISLWINAQTPSQVTGGSCTAVVANFNTNDNGFNSPSVYGSIFDSSLYYHSGRGYWTYLPPFRTTAPGFPRVMNIISPPFSNSNPTGTFNVGFHYIVNNPAIDRFQIRIISMTQSGMGTVTNVEASSGVQPFSAWSTPTPYVDGVTPSSTPVPDPTPFLTGFQGDVCIRLIDADIVNSPFTSFRVEVSYIINGATFAVFDDLSVGAQATPLGLPVNFIGLVAERSGGHGVDLKWDVGEEVNVKEYQVERSENGYTFETVGVVQAKGKSIYTFTNYNVPAGTLYYRVKSVDIDQRFKYSGILKLSGINSFSNELKLYPVPARDEITIQHKRLPAKSKIVVTSLEGRTYKIITPRENASHTPINISDLAPGIYFIRLDDGTGNIQTAKMIKN